MVQGWNQIRNQKIPRDKQKWKHNITKPMGCSKSSSKIEIHNDTGFPQETGNTLNEKT